MRRDVVLSLDIFIHLFFHYHLQYSLSRWSHLIGVPRRYYLYFLLLIGVGDVLNRYDLDIYILIGVIGVLNRHIWTFRRR